MAGTNLFTYGPSNVDSLLATTLSAIRKSIADAVFQRIPLLMWLEKKSKIKQSGGASIVVPLMTGKNSTAGSYSGYQTLDVTPQEGITAAQFKWKEYAASVTISSLEEAQNSGDKAMIGLLEAKTKQAEMSLRDSMDIDAWATSQVSTKLDALPVIVASTGNVGDIARSGNTFWQAQTKASGSFAAQGLADLRSLYNNILKQSMMSGAPEVIISDQASFEYYEAALQPAQRFQDSDTASAGFENLKYKAAVWMFDVNTPSGQAFMLNSECLNFVCHSDYYFVNTPFVKPANQTAKTAQIMFKGNLVTDNPRRLGKMTGITA